MLTAGAFLIAYVAGCLLALFRHPIFGLVTYVAVFYLNPPDRWWGDLVPSLRWSLISASVTLVALYIHRSDVKGPRLLDYGLMRGAIFFLGWLALQMLWALEPSTHMGLIVLSAKYVLLIVLIYKCINSTTHLKYFLWAHASGCFYFGLIAYDRYSGGRFEGFGGPGVGEANAGSLQVVTGVIVTFALFLAGKWIQKAAAVGFMPFILNALVTTISRSGFLALGVAGMLFNLFAPRDRVRLVRWLSLAGLALFFALTNPVYWDRIDTLLEAGEKIEGEDTGYGRVVLLGAQVRMFAHHPLGCGHRCTATLSPAYLEDRFLTTSDSGNRGRSSHNTFMTLLVEQGVPGALLYILLLFWVARLVLRLRDPLRSSSGLLANSYAATVAILGAIFVGDLFVDYLKYEARVWFMAILMVIEKLYVYERESQHISESASLVAANSNSDSNAPTRRPA
jgi:hypothetical protein